MMCVHQSIPIHARARGRARVVRSSIAARRRAPAAFPRREALPSDEKHGEGA